MPQAIDWPRNDAMRAEGVPRRERARRLGIAETTLRDAEKRRALEGGTVGPPGTRAPIGPSGTLSHGRGAPTSSLPVPLTPELARQLQNLEARLKAYIEQRLEEVIGLASQSGVPTGPTVPLRLGRVPRATHIPAYPDDPKKDARYNLHVPAGELWELKAVAAVLGLDPSRQMRHLWETFRTTMEAKQALQRGLEAGGPSTETRMEVDSDG